MPMSLAVLCLVLGLIFLWLNRHIRLGKILCSLGVFILLIFSWQPISQPLMQTAEDAYPKFEDQPVDYVVVLGNEVISDPRLSILDQLSSSARSRLLEGLRIANAQPNSTLIVSGYAGNNTMSCAEAYKLAAIALGFDQQRIIELRDPKDTHEEALAVKALVQDKSIALVTSASHMQRAMYYFEMQNIQATAAPTFYLAKQRPYTEWRFNADGLKQSERAIHEWLGQLWQRIKPKNP